MWTLRPREPVSAGTHLLGTGLAIIGLALLVYRGAVYGTAWHAVAFTVYGISLVALYATSTLYHGLQAAPGTTRVLRKVDHMMIFLLIAGTYTPFLLLPLRGPWGWSLLGIIWGFAAVGMVVKLFWMGAPRWLSTGIYLLMGWLVLVAIYPLTRALTDRTLVWLAAGGGLYTVGALFYALKWPNPWPGTFGFHEIWHLFVLGGSVAHYAAVLQLL